MSESWVQYVGQRPRGLSVRIIPGTKAISVSREAVAALGTPPRVTLFFDRDARIIGIAPAADDAPDSLRLSQGQVSGAGFTRWAGLGGTDFATHPAVMENGVLVVRLPAREGRHGE